MIGFDIGGPEAIIVLVIVLVLFGGSQIPKLARNLGRAQKEFKDGIDEGQRIGIGITGHRDHGHAGDTRSGAHPAGEQSACPEPDTGQFQPVVELTTELVT